MSIKSASRSDSRSPHAFAVLAICLAFAAIGGSPGIAHGDSTLTNYLLLGNQDTNSKTFDWTGATSADIAAPDQNWNLPEIEKWGAATRAADSAVDLYSVLDPAYTPPNGELFPIELEFGDTTITPRSPGTKNVRFYTDFGPSAIRNGLVDRAEVHIFSTLQHLGAKTEGETLWLGWSEYYVHLDEGRTTTILQFRNQPEVDTLQIRGFSQSQIDDLEDARIFEGGPSSAITTVGVNGEAFFHFSARETSPLASVACVVSICPTLEWTVPAGNSHQVSTPIQTGRWYDFVVQMKYSQDTDGRFRVWVYDHSTHPSGIYSVTDSPEWDFEGATMYDYPSGYALPIPAPELRWGLYRHGAKSLTSIAASERHMEKHLGPVRMWVGGGDEGFDAVKPR